MTAARRGWGPGSADAASPGDRAAVRLPAGGRLGTRADMEQQLAFMTELSAEVKKASDAGKCFSPADTEVKLPNYASLLNYEQNLAWNVHRWCGYWGRGI